MADSFFPLTDLGEGLGETIVREWLVSEGSQTERSQPLVEVETSMSPAVPARRSAALTAALDKD